MKAMVLNQLADITANSAPLTLEEWPTPVPKGDEILVQVSACGVCHTEIDEIEGRTPPPQLPIILGHQVVGTIAARGPQATQYDIGARVGVAWIFAACGDCAFCRTGDENLCPDFKATGRDADGGYAQFMTVPQGFATTIPDEFNDVEAAPLLCAGAIGYRSLELTGIKEGQILGLTGFGASAHLVLKLANYRYPNSPIFVFARSREKQRFAKSLGATWAGDTTDSPPAKIDGIIDTTPAWKPVLAALENLKPGGRLGGILE